MLTKVLLLLALASLAVCLDEASMNTRSTLATTVPDNLYMYLPVVLEVDPSFYAGDDTISFSLEVGGDEKYVSESLATSAGTEFRFLGIHNIQPAEAEFYLTANPSGTTQFIDDVLVCSSPFVDAPAGCGVTS